MRISRTWRPVAIRRNWQSSQISSSNSLPTAITRPDTPMYLVGCDPNGNGPVRRDRFINDGRIYFVKVSYLFRR